MFSLVVTVTTGFSYRIRSLLKKWHFLDLVCLVYVVTITTGCRYSNRSLLIKWHFKIEVVLVKSALLKKWHFLDPICAYKSELSKKYKCTPPSLVLLGRAGCIISFLCQISSPQKVALSEPYMFSIGSNHYNWV